MPHKCLWRGEKDIRKHLQATLDAAVSAPYDSYTAQLVECLGMLTSCLHVTLAELMPAQELPADVYFWPGYDSILSTPNKVERLTARKGYSGASPNHAYEQCLCKTAFSSVLTKHEQDRFSDGSPFVPGGTHPFFSQVDLTLTQDSPLNVLAVEIGEPKRTLNPWYADTKNGVLSIYLRRSQSPRWGGQIARILNDRSIVHDRERARVVVWPFAREDNDDSLPASTLSTAVKIRRSLYNVWLLCNLGIPPTSQDASRLPRVSEWVSRFLIRLRSVGLEDLARRIEDLAEEAKSIAHHRYPCWYTLNLERTVSFSGSSGTTTFQPNYPMATAGELGSLMVLSSHRIVPEYFLLIKPWVERIFSWMRAVESSILTLRAGAESQSHEFVHQVAGLIDEVLFDSGMPHLSPSARNAVWHMKALVRVWGSRDFQARQPIFENPDPFWKDFSKYSTRQLLEFLADNAIRHALRRSIMPGTRGDLVAPRVQDYVADHYSDPVHTRNRLGFSLPTGDVPQWVTANGFVVAFHHCFWQAAQHALRASFCGLEAPFLWLQFEEMAVTIVNRSEEENPDEALKSSRDSRFFRRLQERMAGFLRIDRRSDRGRRVVLTTIRRSEEGN